MPAKLNRLRLTQVERAIEPFEAVRAHGVPPGGWLRTIREALGRSLRTQADRVGISAATLHQSELTEAQGGISLAQLRKLAEGLDCELVYALVPRRPLHEVVESQAESLARREVLGVAHTMGLEDQRPSDAFLERQVDDRRRELLSGSWAKLWR